MKHTPHFSSGKQRKNQGSALIAVMILSFFVIVVSGSYLKLSLGEYKSAIRSTLHASSLNLAESGVEMALDDLAKGVAGTGSTWKSTVSDYLNSSVSGHVRYVVLDPSGSSSTIYAEGIIDGGSLGGEVSKQIKVTVSSGIQPFKHGVATGNGISFSGNGVSFDSFNSNYGGYNAPLAASPVAVLSGYGHLGFNKSDNITISSSSIDLDNANVYGYIAISPTGTFTKSNNGMVASYAGGVHDPSRVNTDFYEDYPIYNFSGTYTNPTTQTINGSGTFTGGAYKISSMDVGNNKELVINGDVTLVLSGDINVKGKITITAGSSLTVFTSGDVDIGGNGVVNVDGLAGNFMLFGTAPAASDGTSGQTIKLAGNGALHAGVYAPGATVEMKGFGSSGAFEGGVVANEGKMTGGTFVHFDEALRDMVLGGGSYQVESWIEMNGTSPGTSPVDLDTYFASSP